MHDAAYRAIIRAVADRSLAGARVVEIGSYNVNGSVAPIFATAASYIGVDIRPGPGVDLVIAPDQALPTVLADHGPLGFDIVVTTEALEHTADPAQIVRDAWAILRPGGALLLTAAAPERTPHGCDGGALPSHEPYTAIDPSDLTEWLADWEDVQITHDPAAGDVYAVALRPMAGLVPAKEITR